MCARTRTSSSLAHFRKSTAWRVLALDLAAPSQISFRHSILSWTKSFPSLRYEAQRRHSPSATPWCQREELTSPEYEVSCAIGWDRKKFGTLNLMPISS